MIPNILAIAGSDPSGGAGIQADIKAISANGGYAMAAITALTVQNTQGVSGIHPVPPDFIRAQIDAVLADIRVDAIKIGMLGDRATIDAVASAISGCGCPVVLDPVMVAKGGDRLLRRDAVQALRDRLMPLADIITPNLPEAADLLSSPEAVDAAGMEAQAAALLALGPRAVLLKGGHLPGACCPDLLMRADSVPIWVEAPRHVTRNSHGTGCTLSSALTTWLALTGDADLAMRKAKSYARQAIVAADGLSVGQGHGPTDHFWTLRSGECS